jgi:hypothetical protein
MLQLAVRPLLVCFVIAGSAFAAPEEVALDSLTLGESPNEKEVVAYLKAVRKATEVRRNRSAEEEGQNTRSAEASGPKYADLLRKLEAVPPQFIEVLLKEARAAKVERTSIRFANAITFLLGERPDLPPEAKDLFIRYVAEFPVLANAIVRNEWVKGSEAKLLSVAKSSRDFDAPRFVELVAQIDTPEARKFMPDLLTRGPAATMSSSITAAKKLDLTWLDWDPLVQKAWRKAKESGQSDIFSLAPVAARHGASDALLMLAKKLNGAPDPYNQSKEYEKMQRREYKNTLEAVLEIDETTESALVKHVLDHRDVLVFDKTTRKYKVPAAIEGSAAKKG